MIGQIVKNKRVIESVGGSYSERKCIFTNIIVEGGYYEKKTPHNKSRYADN